MRMAFPASVSVSVAAECGLPAVWLPPFRPFRRCRLFLQRPYPKRQIQPPKCSHSCAKVGTHVVRFSTFAAETDCTLEGICLFRISGVAKTVCTGGKGGREEARPLAVRIRRQREQQQPGVGMDDSTGGLCTNEL